MNIDILELLEKEQSAFKAGIEYQKNKQDEFAIEVLLSYHNSLFFLELKEDEAKEILKNIKKQKGL